MPSDAGAPFAFPPVGHQEVTEPFDGGRVASGGHVLLLVAAKRRLSLADRLAAGWTPTSCAGVSDCPCPTRIMMRAATCGSTSAASAPRVRPPSCCGPARWRPGAKAAVMCGASPAASAAMGRARGGRSAAMAWREADPVQRGPADNAGFHYFTGACALHEGYDET